MLKDSFSEERSFAGCLVPIAVGVLGGGGLGFWYFRSSAEAAGSAPMGMDFMGAIAGACAGLFVGALIGFVIDRVMTRRRRREEEF